MKKIMAIAGEGISKEARDFLSDRFEFVSLPADPLIAKEVSCHADMILCIFNNCLYTHASYYEDNKDIIDRMIGFGNLQLVCSIYERNGQYPNDVGFNALCMNGTILCKADAICPELALLPIVNTKQGYAGCTALWVGDTVVTADPSTIKSCEANNIPYYKISGEDIILPGYDKGFIGGACGVCGDTVYICGDYTKSRSGMELYAFCKSKGFSLVSICDGDVTDVGGIKFI